MRNPVKRSSPEVALERVLDALAQELIEVCDEEILETAKDLGMNLAMKESAAFAGVTYAARMRAADFFDLDTRNELRLSVQKKPPRE